jgi:hypothetical protein
MFRKAQKGEVSKSGAILDLLKANPKLTANEVVSTLSAKGMKMDPSLVYYVKGKMKGSKGHRRKKVKQAAMTNGGVTATSTADVLATIKKVTGLASEVGGLKKLKALIEALGE